MPAFQCILTGFLVMPTLFVVAWDIAALTKNEMNFFNKSQYMGNVGGRLKQPQSATYDPVRGYLYVMDVNQRNNSIVRANLLQLDPQSTSVAFQAVISNLEMVFDIAFDPVTNTLFWITGKNHSIMKLTMNHSGAMAVTFPQSGILIHQFNQERPHAITVDSCRGVLYWTNISPQHPTIEKSNFDGTNREVIIKTGLQQPYGIEVDMRQKKIYWCDTTSLGFQYQIERANLDGSNREVVKLGAIGIPTGFSISRDLLYWVDLENEKLLSLPKNSVRGMTPKVVQNYQKDVYDLISNSLYLDFDTDECPALNPFMDKIRKSFQTEMEAVQEVEEVANCPPLNFCLNEGTQVNGTCVCQKGFRGSHCEVPVCLNYCIGMAKCEVDIKTEQPVCHCIGGWGGDRCERDLCLGFCLNGGNCSLDNSDQTICHCPNGFYGTRCQYESNEMDDMCETLCLEQLQYSQATKVDQFSQQRSDGDSIVEVRKMSPHMCRFLCRMGAPRISVRESINY